MEKFNIIPLHPDSSKPVVQWEKYQHERFPAEQLQSHHGNLGIICGAISGNLVVVDFDLKDGMKKEGIKNVSNAIKEVDPIFLETSIVSTPHGFHFYYRIEGDVIPARHPCKNAGYNKKLKFAGSLKTHFGEYMEGIDILGEGGFVVAPKSIKNGVAYTERLHLPIRHLSLEKFEQLKSILYLEKPQRMRRQFLDILNGKFDVEDYAEKTGKEEFLYWKGLYREAWHFAKLTPEELFQGLQHNQSSFDAEETKTQLQYHPYTEKPFTNETLAELFPDYSSTKKTPSSSAKNSTLSVEEKEKEPTTKEIIDIIAMELQKEFDIITLKESDQILIRNSMHYSLDISELERALINKAEIYSKGSYRFYKENILLKIRVLTSFSQDEFYTDPWVISFENGLYDIHTDIFYSKDSATVKELKLFYALPHEYKEGQFDCPKFKQALREWIYKKIEKDNKILYIPQIALISDIFEGIGYCLTMNNSMKTAFINFGVPDTGKTQLLNIIMGIIGRKNYSSMSIKRLTQNDFGPLFLQFKILNAAGETPQKKIYDTDVFKNATGGDVEIGAEIKGGKRFNFPPYAKFWFNTNKIPPLEDINDNAFFSRIIILLFNNIFKQNSCTRNFFREILNDPDEVQGIIHNAIKGLHRLLRRNGFRKRLKKNTREIWLYNSDEIYRFIHECCILDKSARIFNEELWEAFNDVAATNLTKGKFTIELQKHGIIKKQMRDPTEEKPDRRREFYVGIRLKEYESEFTPLETHVISKKKTEITEYMNENIEYTEKELDAVITEIQEIFKDNENTWSYMSGIVQVLGLKFEKMLVERALGAMRTRGLLETSAKGVRLKVEEIEEELEEF